MMLPTTRLENAVRLVFVNGKLSTELSDTHFPSGMIFSEGSLRITKNSSLALPIHLLFVNTETHEMPYSIHLEENASVSLIEEHDSPASHAITMKTEIQMEKNSRLNFYKIQTSNASTNLLIHQQRESVVNLFSLANGATFARDQITINLNEKEAECHLRGFYSLHQDGQAVEHHLQVNHHAEHGKSSMVYKGILDKKSRATFNGKVYIHPKAQRIQASQANHNLLLSPLAEVSTKPELEIYADDVKCTHGATVGQLDQEALFYLCSRGIEKATAMQLLLNAFAEDVMNDIKNPLIKDYIQKQVNHHVEL